MQLKRVSALIINYYFSEFSNEFVRNCLHSVRQIFDVRTYSTNCERCRVLVNIHCVLQCRYKLITNFLACVFSNKRVHITATLALFTWVGLRVGMAWESGVRPFCSFCCNNNSASDILTNLSNLFSNNNPQSFHIKHYTGLAAIKCENFTILQPFHCAPLVLSSWSIVLCGLSRTVGPLMEVRSFLCRIDAQQTARDARQPPHSPRNTEFLHRPGCIVSSHQGQ